MNSVCLAEVAIELGLGEHLRLGKGEEQSGGREKPSILADAMEAVLGAVYLDGGLDAARRLVLDLLGERIQSAIDAGGGDQDHKSRLQERLATVTTATATLRVRRHRPGPRPALHRHGHRSAATSWASARADPRSKPSSRRPVPPSSCSATTVPATPAPPMPWEGSTDG